jgi:DNA-binding transcriptional ArsR family regulator
MNKNLYLHFLETTKQVAEQFPMKHIDPVCKLMLEEIAMGVARNQPLKVSDAIELKSIASRSTLHRKLSILTDAGLVKLVSSSLDKRTKQLTITATGMAYFAALSTAIEHLKLPG